MNSRDNLPTRPRAGLDTQRRAACMRLAQSLLVCGSWPAAAATVRLQPHGATQGTRGARHAGSFDWAGVRPGDVVELAGGDYIGDVTLQVRGSQAQPVVVRAAAGEVPVIRGSLRLDGAAWVTVEGLTFSGANGIAVMLGRGASHVTVRNNVVKECGLGIWIGAGAGGLNLIEGNVVHGHKTHGIAIDRVNLAAGKQTTITGNRVFDNGHHGIEINGSRYVVERNRVFRNGGALPGTSGIHCYAKDADEGTGCHNVIRHNVTWGQRDRAGPDGNGIQLDRWCDHNEVVGNLAHDNDGAGINLFHAANNRIVGNALYRNMLDVAKSHLPRLRGELVVTNDTDMRPRVTGVHLLDNLVVARRAGVAALVLDEHSRRGVVLRGNQLHHEGAGPLLRVDALDETEIGAVERMVPGAAQNGQAAPPFERGLPQVPQAYRVEPPLPASR